MFVVSELSPSSVLVSSRPPPPLSASKPPASSPSFPLVGSEFFFAIEGWVVGRRTRRQIPKCVALGMSVSTGRLVGSQRDLQDFLDRFLNSSNGGQNCVYLNGPPFRDTCPVAGCRERPIDLFGPFESVSRFRDRGEGQKLYPVYQVGSVSKPRCELGKGFPQNTYDARCVGCWIYPFRFVNVLSHLPVLLRRSNFRSCEGPSNLVHHCRNRCLACVTRILKN
mmetsp:Transcript_223/g.545  ORF Transcript_223/g.545 Transcript_223/m.545 type:complete len:223 (-) Transcript_223:2661-3329(-)